MIANINIREHVRDGGLEHTWTISSEDLAVALQCYRPEQVEAWRFRNNVQVEEKIVAELGASDILKRAHFSSTRDTFMVNVSSRPDLRLMLAVINRMTEEVAV